MAVKAEAAKIAKREAAKIQAAEKAADRARSEADKAEEAAALAVLDPNTEAVQAAALGIEAKRARAKQEQAEKALQALQEAGTMTREEYEAAAADWIKAAAMRRADVKARLTLCAAEIWESFAELEKIRAETNSALYEVAKAAGVLDHFREEWDRTALPGVTLIPDISKIRLDDGYRAVKEAAEKIPDDWPGIAHIDRWA